MKSPKLCMEWWQIKCILNGIQQILQELGERKICPERVLYNLMDQLILTCREALWWCSATHVIYLTLHQPTYFFPSSYCKTLPQLMIIQRHKDIKKKVTTKLKAVTLNAFKYCCVQLLPRCSIHAAIKVNNFEETKTVCFSSHANLYLRTESWKRNVSPRIFFSPCKWYCSKYFHDSSLLEHLGSHENL